MEQMENNIKPSPFDNLSETDLNYLLEHNRDSLTEAQVFEIKSRIEKARQREIDELIIEPEPAKTKVMTFKSTNNRAGYVDVIILMLTTWVTCLCGMAYIYFNIMG